MKQIKGRKYISKNLKTFFKPLVFKDEDLGDFEKSQYEMPFPQMIIVDSSVTKNVMLLYILTYV